jgi:hypothetical protein
VQEVFHSVLERKELPVRRKPPVEDDEGFQPSCAELPDEVPRSTDGAEPWLLVEGAQNVVHGGNTIEIEIISMGGSKAIRSFDPAVETSRAPPWNLILVKRRIVERDVPCLAPLATIGGIFEELLSVEQLTMAAEAHILLLGHARFLQALVVFVVQPELPGVDRVLDLNVEPDGAEVLGVFVVDFASDDEEIRSRPGA